MLLVDDLAAGGTKNLRHTPRGLVTLMRSDSDEMLLRCHSMFNIPGHVAQSVTCLGTYACLTADPGVASLIRARSHTFLEIDHEIISTVILLLSVSNERMCMKYWLIACSSLPGKMVVR